MIKQATFGDGVFQYASGRCELKPAIDYLNEFLDESGITRGQIVSICSTAGGKPLTLFYEDKRGDGE